jgi:type II secretory pathway pseudopilin PulG
MKWTAIFALVCLIGLSGTLFGAPDPSSGVVVSPTTAIVTPVVVPANFNADVARAALKQARLQGDAAKAAELGRQLHAWWLQNRPVKNDPRSTGFNPNPNPGPALPGESRGHQSGPTPFWGTDIRISPLDYDYGVKIASLSTGELYAFSIYYDGSSYHGMINRSTNNGLTWSVYWDNAFSTTYSVLDPSIIIVNDTLVYSYILCNISAQTYRTWFKVSLPGASDNPVYYGSPTGGFNAVPYYNLRACSDVSVYPTVEYLYATWSEMYGTTPDSSHVMFARSNELDVSAWEITPTIVDYSNGGAYFYGERIAYGSGTADHLWLVNWLHPNLYPATYDRCICGYVSADYGSTWGTTVYITPYSDHLDQTGPAIAGAHINLNWACLYQQADTTTGLNQDVDNAYSLDDGTTWTPSVWIVPYTEFLPDIHVDNASTAFYASVRQDVSAGNELAKYKMAAITDPVNWTGSVSVNNDVSDLSGVYAPSITRNNGTGDAVIAWTNYAGSIYSIWMDAESWTGIEEGDTKTLVKVALNIVPNPNRGVSNLYYTVRQEGNVRIAVYDAAGRFLKNLVNETRHAGTYIAQLNVNLPNGVYFVRLDTPDGNASQKLIVTK